MFSGGVSYLAQLQSQFPGNTAAQLAAYNWGPGNVTKAMQQNGADWLSAAPSETQNYVSTVLGSTAAAGAVEVDDSGDAGDSGTDTGDSGSYAGLAIAAAAVITGIWFLT